MRKLYTLLIVTVGTFGFFAALSFVAYVEQKAVNSDRAKYNASWCNVDFGSSKATMQCDKIERIEHETND